MEYQSNLMLLLSLLSSVIYLGVGVLLWLRLLNRGPAKEWSKSRLLYPALLAMALHGWVLIQYLFTPSGIDVGFYTVFSLVGWLVALLLLLATLSRPIECLGMLVFPFTALTVVLRTLNTEQHFLAEHLSAGLQFHILISILAYSLLSIAVVQAILLYLQELHLHNKQPGGFVRSLPPMETMETMLFQMIGLGFLVLSVSLLSGALFLEDLFAQHLAHKTVLSIIAWILFAILLWGRWQFGWRGRTAIRWTISGFIMLMLAYFGSKFVIELILQR